MRTVAKSALLFAAIGLLIYAGIYYASEQLLYRTGRSNPFFKIATADLRQFDWVILGASHAMPLDFGDFNTRMERETGQRILNLASPGTGPLYNRFVLEHFLRTHRTANLLYALDSFAFYAAAWNEDRFADAKLLRRTPFDAAIALRLWAYSQEEGVDPRAALNYVTGFAKVNNRERFERDIWEGESQFERVYRPSTTAVTRRISYLYPQKPTPEILARYLKEFGEMLDLARQHELNVMIMKLPVPGQFRSRLPDETAFDQAMSALLKNYGLSVRDLSTTLDDPRFFFDTDHMNRTGLTEFFARHLKPILQSAGRA